VGLGVDLGWKLVVLKNKILIKVLYQIFELTSPILIDISVPWLDKFSYLMNHDLLYQHITQKSLKKVDSAP
jgi:hypothetical protein